MSDKKPAGKPGGKNDTPFFEIKDPILIAKIFDLATRQQIKIVLWLKNQAIKFETTLTFDERAYKTMMALYTQEVSREKFAEQLKAQGTDDILGSLIIEHTSFFFRTTCSAPDDSKFINLAVPPSIFKLQRRGNLRIPFQRNFAPTLTVLDPTKQIDGSRPIQKSDILAMRMLDLSVGGCGAAAKVEDEAKFPVGVKLRDMRFLIRGMEVVGEGYVRHTIKTVNDRGKPMLRVGIQFASLKMDFETNIAQFVLDESRKIFTLLK